MEISSLNAQQMLTLESGVEDRAPVSRQESNAVQNPENQTAPEEDRVDLVTTQNLASPPQEQVDVDQAQQILQQVQQDWGQMGRQDLQGLYQYDRLRDLCAQVQQAQF